MTVARRSLQAVTFIAGTLAPGPIGRAAFRLFCTPPKRSRLTPGEQRLAHRTALVMSEARREQVAFDGGKVATYAWSDGPSGRRPRILLVHGWTGRALAMSAFVAPLRDAGFDVIALDLPAHGESPGTVLNLVLGAKSVLAVAEHFGGIAGVVTHSFGGPIAVLAAEGGAPLTRAMPIQSIVLLSAPNSLAQVTRDFAARVSLPRSALAEMEREILRIAGRPVEAYRIGEFLARISKPTLIIHDEGDQDVPISDADAIKASAPFVRIERTVGLGHRRMVIAPQVIDATVRFLSQASA